MRREPPVRIREGLGVKLPRATRLVICCRGTADEAMDVMRGMMSKLKLTVNETKTRLCRLPEETFDFLGFTHHCGQTRQGSFKVQRRTSTKKFRGKLRELRNWIKGSRTQKTHLLLRGAKVRLQGWLNYYAITDNSRSCAAFRSQFERLLFKWLNRRSQRSSYTWPEFWNALRWVGWPSIRINRNLDPFRRVAPKEC